MGKNQKLNNKASPNIETCFRTDIKFYSVALFLSITPQPILHC